MASPQYPAEQLQTIHHRMFPNETSPFLYSLAPAALTSPHFQPLLSFPIPVSLYMPCLPSASLHSVASPLSKRLIYLSPILFSASSPPFSLSSSISSYLLLPSLHLFFPSSTHVSGAFTDGLGVMLGVIVRAESSSLLDIYLKGRD